MRKIYIFLLFLCFAAVTACSPVEKVKWGSVDLFGNRIKVRTITSSIAGSSGSVAWGMGENINNDSDVVVATIRRGDDESMIHFLYNSSRKECTLTGFHKNGEAVSPFMIYKYLGRSR